MQKKLRKTYNEIMSSVHLVENPDGVYRYPLSGIARRLGCSVKEILENEFQPLEPELFEDKIYRGEDGDIYISQNGVPGFMLRIPTDIITDEKVRSLIISYIKLFAKYITRQINEQQAQLN